MNKSKRDAVMLAAAAALYLIAAVILLAAGQLLAGGACAWLTLIGVRSCIDAAHDGWGR